ncbi:MAG: ATP-binding protein [Prevotellaceae bacterium]|nr:ATP-binding protein [Prevotellaceae bacterium]
MYQTENEPSIYIQIDKEKRKIVIEDNATGIKQAEVLPLLGNIAQSTKNKYEDKGFRGIGRLGGLGYCEKLTFETSFFGEEKKSRMTWDAKRLKELFNDETVKVDAAEIISIITDYSLNESENINAHYFNVTMENVTNEDLLDIQKVREYLSMVAPVPFANTFTFRNKIYKKAREKGIAIDEYNIYVNTDKLFKGYKDYIYKNNAVSTDETILDVIFFEDYLNEELLFWGWYGISKIMWQIPNENKERGIRLRKSNIQIGLETRLDNFHKDHHQGNKYFIGEVYALNKELIPNGRRDFFIDNKECTQFSEKLIEVFKKLYSLYYDFSKKNSAISDNKKLEGDKETIKDPTLDKQKKQKVTAEIERLEKKVTDYKISIPRILNKYKDTNTEIFNVLSDSIKESGFVFSPKQDNNVTSTKSTPSKPQIITTTKTTVVNPTISQQEKNILDKVFSVLRKNLIKATAEELIKKIEEEINK